jgi:rfaE bifunctional protein nucleotidyltransferase chain/domain
VIISFEQAIEMEWLANPYTKIVLAHGCFDILHPGHIKHLEDAKAFGDYLVVGVTSDKYVRAKKGANRPVISEDERAAVLDALECVGDVIVIPDPTAVPLIEAIKPQFFVRGEDHKGEHSYASDVERQACENNGGELVYTEGRLGSSTQIIERVTNPLTRSESPPVYKEFADEALEWISNIKQSTALLIGEQITDRYIYVTPAGKSTKENTISYLKGDSEDFNGGIDAVRMHLSQNCVVQVFETDEEPVIKTRYLDMPFRSKLFSIAEQTKVSPLSWLEVECIVEQTNYDIVCVADFGHGLISEYIAKRLSSISDSSFLALTVQSNSLNYGFNTLRKWSRASYVVADEEELRLACEDATGDISYLMAREFERLGPKMLAVTRGHSGCMVYDGSRFVSIPALDIKAVDRMGAGDAFFGWTIPLVMAGAPIEVIGIIGNIAGAIHVSSIGNSCPVFYSSVEQMVRSFHS